MEPVRSPLTIAEIRIGADSTASLQAKRKHHSHVGIGNTALALANSAGKIALISLSSTCVFTGAAPWFWPLTNLVGPYGITWPVKVEFSSAAVILARSALAACSSA